MKLSLSLWVFVAWVLFGIVDIWFDVVTTALFVKISLTLALLWCLVFFIRLLSANKQGEAND